MRIAMIIPGLLSTLAGTHAYANCETGSKTLFSCLTAKDKRIEVCDDTKTIAYSFGKPQAKPEIALKIPRNQAATSQWQGIGRYISYTVEIPNGNTVYSVFWSVDKLSEQHAVEAGVHVMIDGALAATVNCAKNIVNKLEGIDLKPAE